MEKPNLSNDSKDEVLYLASQNLVNFGQLFLPDDFGKSKPAPFQYEVGEALLNKDIRKLCVVLPRGHTKSTLAKAALLYKLYFNPQDKMEFIAWVSEEQGQAIDHLKYIRHQVEFNPYLNYYFGSIVGSKWTEKEIETVKGDRIIAKGTNQRLRGRAQLSTRYTKIILDDFESELNTKTRDRRTEIKEWLMSTVYPSLEESKGNEGKIWLLGTIVHFDSALQGIYESYLDAVRNKTPYTWHTIFHKAIDDNGQALWPSYFSIAKLKQIRQDYENVGQVHKFSQEYLNDARDVANAPFKIDRLNYYDGDYIYKNKFSYIQIGDDYIPIYVYMGVDLAATASDTSDMQSIVVLGVDKHKNRYVIDTFYDKIPIYDMPKKIVELAKEYNPRRVTIETVAAQEMVRDMVTRLSSKDRKLIPGIFKGAKPPHGIKKEDRLLTALGPIINTGKLYVKRNMSELVDELFEFPKSRHDDFMDALYYANHYIGHNYPKSNTVDRQQFESKQRTTKTGRAYSWLTGARK